MVPDGADVILKLRAVVVNGDLDDYMTYYKRRYCDMCTSPATTPPASPTSDSPHDRNNQKCHTLQEDAPAVAAFPACRPDALYVLSEASSERYVSAELCPGGVFAFA